VNHKRYYALLSKGELILNQPSDVLLRREEETALSLKLLLSIFVMVLASTYSGAHDRTDDERGIRDLISQWDIAYRALDAKAMVALETPDFELVDRFGNWFPQTSRKENERMWSWAFTNIYRGKPGPKHSIERIRFLQPGVAIVQARAYWAEVITLPDGTRIPPHGQLTTFVVVKQKEGWRIAAQNIHNKMSGDGPGDGSTARLPWNEEGLRQRK
jgi:uncharacterized protein (TIGR02246 family)